jgi:glycosyltransferase involved in cell wall biosynthesis
MNVVLLCEGNARTFDSWSGISQNIVDQLERRGHVVLDRDADLTGLVRLAGAALTFSTSRKRWWVRYHLASLPFRLRSRRARRHYRKIQRRVDLILQFGATFAPPDKTGAPLFLYCDGNIRLAEAGATGGESDAAYLSPAEINAVAERERKVYERAEHIFCISDRVTESFIADFGISHSKISTIYAGANLDPAGIHPDWKHRETASPTVLFVGRDFARKGGDHLLHAFRIVREQIPDARLTIVGPERLPAPQEGVDFLGKLNRDNPEDAARLLAAFQRARVFCMPSRFEGLSISVLEAMLFALPCVSAFSPWTPPEQIVEGETGLLAPINDAPRLAEQLLYLLKNPGEAERMGIAGRQRALDLFTWDRVVERMMAIIDNHVCTNVQKRGHRLA